MPAPWDSSCAIVASATAGWRSWTYCPTRSSRPSFPCSRSFMTPAAVKRSSCGLPLLGRVRLLQQVEIGLQARRVGEADLAQRCQAKARRDADELTHRRRRVIGTAKPGGRQCEDTIGKDEVAVAIDR